MNVIHVVSSLKIGGAEKFVRNISKLQVANGLSVTVVSFGNGDDPFKLQLEEAGIPVILIQGSMLSRWFQIVKLIRRADVVHVHSPSVIRVLLPVSLLLIRKNIVYTIHGEVDPPQSLLRLSHRAALIYLSNVTAVSEQAKLSTHRRYGWDPKPITVIENGVPIPVRPSHDHNQLKLKLGTVCRLISLKNINHIITTVERFVDQISTNIELHIWGDGPERAAIESQIKLAQLEPYVFVHGASLDEDQIYSSFDVLVICSETEGLPMSLLEGFAYGLPAISTPVGAIPSALKDNHNGWLYEVGDLDALFLILEKLSMDKRLIKPAGDCAYKLVSEQYGLTNLANDFYEIYQNEH